MKSSKIEKEQAVQESTYDATCTTALLNWYSCASKRSVLVLLFYLLKGFLLLLRLLAMRV
jgi:hypothetical protein